MPFDDARSWEERERDVLDVLDREFRAHRFPSGPQAHGWQAVAPWWSRLSVSSSLLIADALVLATAAQSGAPALYLVAMLMSPLIFLPYLRPGRRHRSASPRKQAGDRRA